VNREKAIAEYSDALPIAQDMRVAGKSLRRM
jgi:hypothetical protein